MGALGRARRQLERSEADEMRETAATPWDEHHSMFEDEAGEFRADAVVWCLHCERAYKMAEMVLVDELWCCKYAPECGGNLIDIRGWAEMREQYRPEWPEVPVEGTVYHCIRGCQGVRSAAPHPKASQGRGVAPLWPRQRPARRPFVNFFLDKGYGMVYFK